MTDFSESDAIRAALDVAARKRGRPPAWLHAALQPRQEAPRAEPEAARLSGEALIRALHGEPTDDDEDDPDDPPVAA
jgi:Arc/MetJ-type ribon-helix-helix transcriptional regulator